MDLANKPIIQPVKNEYQTTINIVKKLIELDIELVGRMIILIVIIQAIARMDLTLIPLLDFEIIEFIARILLLAWMLLPAIKDWNLLLSAMSLFRGSR